MTTGDFSIVARPPVVRQADESWHETLDTERESYAVSENIGFDQASLTLTGSPEYLADWFERGLVRDVSWTAPDGGIAWAGYINRMALSTGDTVMIKSIDDMANRIILHYVPLDTSKTPAEAGAKTTIQKDDAVSQAYYGVKVKIVNGGECTDATADDNALAHLSWHSAIPQTQTISAGQGRAPSLQVSMRGYAYMANWYVYSQVATSDTANADVVVAAMLAADPNSVLSASALNIDSCTTATEQYRDDYPLVWKAIQEIATRGQELVGAGYRWTAGVYERQRTTFKAAEGLDKDTGVAYATNKYPIMHQHARSEADLFLEEGGSEVEVWQLRPDRLLRTEGIPGPPMYVTQVKLVLPHRVALQGTSVIDPLQLTIMEECR